jgi:hypothetical protein
VGRPTCGNYVPDTCNDPLVSAGSATRLRFSGEFSLLPWSNEVSDGLRQLINLLVEVSSVLKVSDGLRQLVNLLVEQVTKCQVSD